MWFWIPLFFLILALGLWSAGAVFYTFHWSGLATASFSIAFLLSWLVALKKKRFLIIPIVIELLVLLFFAAMTPKRVFADTVWQTPWGREPQVEYIGNRVIVHNVRDFRYRSVDDYDVRYIDFEFSPRTVRSVDIAVSHWDGIRAIAHTMLSFGFEDGRFLALSMETRLPQGVEQSFLQGFYRQYEILMVLATEEDLFKLRTDFRHEDLYLYRTNATPEQALKLLDYIILRVNTLSKNPEFYNSVTRNCTTSLSPLLRVINPSFTGDLRLLFNGFSDELLFELGYLRHHEGETFDELKRRRLADQYAKLTSDLPYSQLIRTDL
jgi:hypothetical protein